MRMTVFVMVTMHVIVAMRRLPFGVLVRVVWLGMIMIVIMVVVIVIMIVRVIITVLVPVMLRVGFASHHP